MAEDWQGIAIVMFGIMGVALLYGPWQTFWTEWVRDRLFAARNQLFDLAGPDRPLSFDDPAYRKARRELEVLIRFAHQMTWPRLAVYLVFLGPPPPHPEALDALEGREAVAEGRGNVAATVKSLRDGVHRDLTLAILMRSPGLTLVLAVLVGVLALPYAGAYWLGFITDRVAQQVQSGFNRVAEIIVADADRVDQAYRGILSAQ